MRIAPNRNVNAHFRPVLTQALLHCVDPACLEVLGYDSIITSGNDGKHSRTSLHYSDSSADIRIWTTPTSGTYISAAKAKKLAALIRKNLKKKYETTLLFDVVIEETHLHIEFQPKRSLQTLYILN